MSETRTQLAWRATYRANTSANGAQAVRFGTGPQVEAIVSEMTMDEILAAGGTAESGGYNVQVLSSLLITPPAKFAAVQVFGPNLIQMAGLAVLSANMNNGVWYVQVGDFVASET